MKILVTGGAGYIGSHTVLELLKRDDDIVIVDNLCNSQIECVKRIEKLSNKKVTFYEADICDKDALDKIFAKENIEAVIHFAGLKAVGESVKIPIKYYENNIHGTLVLLEVMQKYGVKKIIFSSSATVYGDPASVPVTEDFPKGVCTNPYGWTKSMIEQILVDLHTSDNDFSIVILRYFNPIGADTSGEIGEDPKGIPNNLLPYVAKVAVGQLDEISVYGDDYDTKDGTGVRDYIHVTDLARGHVNALEKLKDNKVHIYNLGTGRGYSVLEVIKAFEKACNKKLKYTIKGRRSGDIAVTYADPTKAREELNWVAEYDIDDMCEDLWRWQSKNPNGFK